MRWGLMGALVAALAIGIAGSASGAEVFEDATASGATPLIAGFNAAPGENNDVTTSLVAGTGVVFTDPNAPIRSGTNFGAFVGCLAFGLHIGICPEPWVNGVLNEALELQYDAQNDQPAFQQYLHNLLACLTTCDQYHLLIALYGGYSAPPYVIQHGILVNVQNGTNRVSFAPINGRYPLISVGSLQATSTTAVIPPSQIAGFGGSTDTGPDHVTLGSTVDGGTVSTGTGDDIIDVRNGSVDSVTCGAGDDTVTADPNDQVDPSCEHVTTG